MRTETRRVMRVRQRKRQYDRDDNQIGRVSNHHRWPKALCDQRTVCNGSYFGHLLKNTGILAHGSGQVIRACTAVNGSRGTPGEVLGQYDCCLCGRCHTLSLWVISQQRKTLPQSSQRNFLPGLNLYECFRFPWKFKEILLFHLLSEHVVFEIFRRESVQAWK